MRALKRSWASTRRRDCCSATLAEFGIKDIEELDLVFQEAGARLRLRSEVARASASRALACGVVEELLLLWRATPAPEQHFLGDDLVIALGLFDDVAAAKSISVVLMATCRCG
jgi:hypothetical protein